MYAYFIAYLAAPETFASANVIELVGSMPDIVKYAGKTILAAPFAFHSLNGLRHLSWDLTKCKLDRAHMHAFLTENNSHHAQGRVFFWIRCPWCYCHRHCGSCPHVNGIEFRLMVLYSAPSHCNL